MPTPEHRLARRRALNQASAANKPTSPEPLPGDASGTSPPSVPSRIAPGVIIFVVVLIALVLALWLLL